MPSTTATCNANSIRATTTDRCTHLRADGKRCADALYPGHATLCHHHLSQQMRGIADGNSIAADILSSVGNFQSASAINIALGKLFVHQITGRISRQDALALAYTCQLLLQTLKMVKSELHECGYDHWWKSETSRILSGPSDLDEITNSTLLPDSVQPLHPPDLTPEPAAGVATATPAPPPPTPPLPSSCSAGLQPSSSSASAPPRTTSSTPPSPSAPAAAPSNSAPPVAIPSPRPAAPAPPLPAAPTAAPRTRPSAEVRCASRDAFPG